MIAESAIIRLLNSLAPRRRSPTEDGLLIGRTRDVHGHDYPVKMPARDRTEHAFVLGKTGMGKTHFLQFIAIQCMHRAEGFVLFDFHGDCAGALSRVASALPGAEDRLVILDPTDRLASPGLNPLELQTDEEHEAFGRASELAAILRARWNVDAFGPRSEELLRNVLYTLAANGLTLVEAPALLTVPAFRARLVARLPSPEIAAYWRDRFEPLSEAMKAAFREPLLNKITGFLVEPSCRHLLGQTHSTVNFRAAMQDGQWILVNLSKGILREHAHTLGNLLFAKLQFDVFSRVRIPPRERRLFSIIVDEVQNLAENDLVTLLTEGRKFGVGLITANQYWEQLPRVLRKALLASGTHVFFRMSHADAAVLAAELSTRSRQRYVGELVTLDRGQAIVRIGSAEPRRVTVPALPKPSLHTMDTADAVRALSIRTYARTRSSIEQDIRQRVRLEVDRSETSHEPTSVSNSEGQHDW